MPNRIVASLLWMLTAAAAVAQQTWTVDDDGGADFNNINDAITAASNGDTVLVYPGRYTSTDAQVVDMQGKAITLRSTDGPDTTIIDAQVARRGIVCASGEMRDTVITGFAIVNGVAPPLAGGGGIFNLLSSPTVTECRFEQNSNDFGGGMYNEGGTPLVLDCVFDSNNAARGAAIFNRGASPEIHDCLFVANAASFGGALQSMSGSSPIISDCTFRGNHAADKGGAIIHLGGGGVYERCLFDQNNSNVSGGAAEHRSQCTVSYTTCTFTGNSSGGGGAMGAYNSVSTIDSCHFEDNHASGSGGALLSNKRSYLVSNSIFDSNTAGQDGGAICEYEGANDVFLECVFVRNVAGLYGGALYADASDSHVTGCLFVANEAAYGGAVATARTDRGPALLNVLIRHNTASINGGGMYRLGGRNLGYSGSVVCSNTPNQIVGNWTDDGSNCVGEDCTECWCFGDFNGDGDVNTLDVLGFLNAWSAEDYRADINGDGAIDTLDVLAFLNAWTTGC